MPLLGEVSCLAVAPVLPERCCSLPAAARPALARLLLPPIQPRYVGGPMWGALHGQGLHLHEARLLRVEHGLCQLPAALLGLGHKVCTHTRQASSSSSMHVGDGGGGCMHVGTVQQR